MTTPHPTRPLPARFLRACIAHPFVLLPCAFYLLTCSPTVGASDPAIMIDEMRNLHLSTRANSHNITLLVGWLFAKVPHHDAAYNANLVSAFLGSLAIGLFYALVLDMFGGKLLAAASASLLMVSHSMWWHSTIIEAYAANAIFTIATLIALERLQREFTEARLSALFFIAGLAVFNHAQMGILSLGAGAVLLVRVGELMKTGQAREAARTGGRCLAWLALGALPWLATFAADALREGGAGKALSSALGGDFRSVMLNESVLSAVKFALLLVALQFPSPFLLAIGVGAVRLWRAWKGSASLAGLVTIFSVNTGFFMFYRTWDRFAFLLPSFIVLAFLGTFGLEAVYRRLARRPVGGRAAFAALAAGSVVLPIYTYSQLADWGERTGYWETHYSNARPANTVDVARYLANPNRRDYDDFERFARALFEGLPPGAVVIDDDSRTFYPLRYFQKYRGFRPDVRMALVNSWGFHGWGLEPGEFAALVRNAWQLNQPLFLTSISFPFDRYVLSMADAGRYRFARYPLAEGRWVYRLVTAAEPGRTPDPPTVERVAVGVNLDRSNSGLRTEFGRTEPLMAAVYFQINGEPFPIQFRWRGPDLKTFFVSQPMSVPFGCRSVWSQVETRTPLPAGWWTVEALSNDRRLGETRFLVR